MMKLTDNKYITENMTRLLTADGWTMATLATATQKQLANYKGIGLLTATHIIREAQRLVNETLLAEAEPPEMETAADEPEAWPDPPRPMSVRVRRLWERRQRS